MKATIALGITALSALSSTAIAGPVGLRIDNEAGTQVEVYVDGSWRGSVFANGERTFTTLPGRRDVRVVSTRGAPLYQDSLVLHPHRMVEVDVFQPIATLRLDNEGSAPLFVDVPGANGFWLNPGQVQSLQVRSGSIPVTTSVSTPRGMTRLGTETLQLAPGRIYEHDIAWVPPRTASMVTVTNGERHMMRVYVGGTEIGVIRGHSTATLSVPVGRQLVTVVEHGGQVVYNQPVNFDGRVDHEILIDANGRCSSRVAGHVARTTQPNPGFVSNTTVRGSTQPAVVTTTSPSRPGGHGPRTVSHRPSHHAR